MASGHPPTRELVAGDVIQLKQGDIVPADARLLDGDPMSLDQSALTGESLPATHNPGDAVFSGSIVRRGQSDALVYATGAKTYFGKTAQLVEQAHTVSHFQKAVLKIGNYLIVLAVCLVATIIGFAIYRGDPILSTLQFALVLTVAAIPGSDADRVVGDDGRRRTAARQEASGGESISGDRRAGRRGYLVCRQNRHTHPEQTHARRTVLRSPM
jgi:high-affinity K+ transport system ATPase subunit B